MTKDKIIKDLLDKKLNKIKISLLNSKQTLIFSKGEVKNSETLNYRTFYPETGGLFSIDIFGPIKDYECLCGDLSGKKYDNFICKFCGGEVISSKLRRIRLGHISLNNPCVNTIFFKITPSYISLILNISIFSLENVLYNNYYIVLFAGDTSLKLNQILNLQEYLYFFKKYNNKFYANTGVFAIKEALINIDLNFEIKLLKKFFIKNKNHSTNLYKRNIIRYRIFNIFSNSVISMTSMILDVLPVLPPDLRPIVKLPDGNLVSSDLNVLYKRVIDRNNRLKKLYSLGAPEIIISNEKKILQESVDNLFDNSKSNNTIAYNSSKQPLKSISSNIKGKFGFFRQNLLGKRVDYSGRSVIVSGPNLKLNQCVIPKSVALELFRPFIYNKLLCLDNFNIKLAKLEVDKNSNLAIDILRIILRDKLVLLNRAPTLHKLGIQAFNVILGNDKVIKLHPLVCSSFNADFDGDQMAIHIPISIKSKVEFKSLLISTNNILQPSSGTCCIAPTQDIILGIYYSSKIENNSIFERILIFNNLHEVKIAYIFNYINLNSKIFFRLKNYDSGLYKIYETTLGRLLIYNLLPKGISYDYINIVLKKDNINKIINFIYDEFGPKYLISFSDSLMKLGFNFVTQSGVSISIDDMITYSDKEVIINKAKKISILYNIDYLNGLLSEVNRKRKILDIWELCSDVIFNITIKKFFSNSDIAFLKNSKNVTIFNSLCCMIDSGARGSETQIKQISCMRGLMFYKNQGLLEVPVITNLKEGLSTLEYFYFSHGSRKTLADTALKTSNAGYLTRRLVEVAGNIMIYELDCGTNNGLNFKSLINRNGNIIESFLDRIFGRVICDDLINPETNLLLFPRNTIISKEKLNTISNLDINILKLRTPLMCESKKGICALCYGYDLSKRKLVNVGEAVGIIAAQSIGEPGTQLTMRTFHTGGNFSKNTLLSTLYANTNGILEYSSSLKYVINKDNFKVVISNIGTIKIKNSKNDILETLRIPYSSIIFVEDNISVKSGDLVCKWNPYYKSIISNCSGIIKFKNFFENINFIKRFDKKTGITTLEIINFKKTISPISPYIDLLCEKKNLCNRNKSFTYKLEPGWFVIVNNNEFVFPGDTLVKNFIDLNNIIDITGGLPKVVELFECTSPKSPAILSCIDGKALILKKKNTDKQYIIVKSLTNKKIFLKKIIPLNSKLLVSNGQIVNKGDMLVYGNFNPHDILSIFGISGLVEFLLTEVKDIYFSQGVSINDKHIEIIIKKMLINVIIIKPGDSYYVPGEIVSRDDVVNFNKKMLIIKGKVITYNNILSGITRSSLNTDSFLNSAAFQQTLSVLSQASIFSRENELSSIKENLMLGRPIPVGTGFYPKILKNKKKKKKKINVNNKSVNKKKKKKKNI